MSSDRQDLTTIFGNTSSQKETEDILRTRTLLRSLSLAGPDYVGKRSFVFSLLEDVVGPSDVSLMEEGIDGVREARVFLHSRPKFGPFKAVVVDCAESLSEPAQDAFLKMCEDAPSSSVIVFVTSDHEMLLPALRSRIEFVSRWKLLSEAEMTEALGSDSPDSIRLCSGRPGLYEVMKAGKYGELYEAVLSAPGCKDPYTARVPEVVRELKGTRGPERDAAAVVIRSAALSIRSAAFLRYAATLFSVPSASAEVHWYRAMFSLQP